MSTSRTAGFGLIEVIVVAAVMLLFFGGLITGVKYSLGLMAMSREKTTALTVATQQIEYVRSLSYDAAGTVSGIPSGLIPQISTTTLNGIIFEKRMLIEYIDDDADGVGAADSNGITTDYKQAKVTVSWTSRGVVKELFLVSNIIPRSIETSVGGGTLRVNVFDAAVLPLPGASVRVVNRTIIPNIDVTKNTDATGVVLFGGAPAGPNYEIFVSKAGYSSDQTYAATTSIPNPTTLPVAVLEADISTMNFFIDELGSLTTRTLGSQVVQLINEPFSGMTGIATSTRIDVGMGVARLRSVAGIYDLSGTFYLNRITPTTLVKWGTLSIASTIPTNTTASVKVYAGTSTLALVPDAVLPGNSSGFQTGQIDISKIDPSLYPELTIGAVLTTSNTAATSNIDSIDVTYLESESPTSGVSLSVVGAKTIGTDGGGGPVYKNSYSVVTSAGAYTFPTIEWDDYAVTPGGYDVAVACPANPVSVVPGVATTQSILLATNTSDSLRVVVENTLGISIENATVILRRGGFSQTGDSRNCGQVFFPGLTAALDYELEVSVSGYATQTITDVKVDNNSVTVVQF